MARIHFILGRHRKFYPLIEGKIELFVRHCCYSKASAHKDRFPQFSREKCFQNLLSTLDRTQVNVTFILDTEFGKFEDHFLSRHRDDKVIPFRAGTEGASFLFLADYISSLSLSPNTPLYILEDDYLHRQGWVEVLKEGFSLPADYITLYDHCDKYFLPEYDRLSSRIYATKSCHWRTTPSTTNTFATRFSTFIEDLPVQRRYSTGRAVTEDHKKFCRLAKKGRTLISSLPGYSTHAEPKYASPCTNWQEFFGS